MFQERPTSDESNVCVALGSDIFEANQSKAQLSRLSCASPRQNHLAFRRPYSVDVFKASGFDSLLAVQSMLFPAVPGSFWWQSWTSNFFYDPPKLLHRHLHHLHRNVAQVCCTSQKVVTTRHRDKQQEDVCVCLSFLQEALLVVLEICQRQKQPEHCESLRVIAGHCESLRVIAGQQMASTCLSRRPSSLRFLLMFILFDQLLVIEMYRSAQEIQIDPKSKLNEQKQYKYEMIKLK